MSSSRPALENLSKQCLIYAAEEKSLRQKMSSISVENEIQLSEKVEKLKEKLELLVKENKRLNLNGGHGLPPLSKSTDTEESLTRDLKFHKKNLSTIEENLKNIQEKTNNDISKSQELEKEYEKLKNLVGDCKAESDSKPFEDLSKKLKILTSSWKSNVLKMENIIKEKEGQLKLLQEQKTQINSKIFKQDQQRRLLDMSHDDMFNLKNSGAHLGDNPDIYHPDVSFLYKPSVKALYST
jgi:hypothetical protein